MTASVADLTGLPGWPALLSAEQAAVYCGVSRDTFDLLVEKGHLPKAVKLPIRRKLWYRQAIDDALGGKGASSAEEREREWRKRYKDRP